MSDFETRELKSTPHGSQLTLPGIKLTLVEGKDRGKEAIARRGVLRVGTAPDNDLVLRDEAISRRHFEVRLRGDEVRIADLGSRNGTTIDGVRIIEAIVAPGSLIRAGSASIRVTTVEEPIVIPLSTRESFGGLIGASVAMREVFSVLERAAPSEATILIEGETGTGKDVAAEAIHAHSSRAEQPFVAIDCGAIAPTLVESELFGHAKGAFTGASSDRQGVFEQADGGTLFLDEVGELPLEMQPKLLRAIETRQVRPVGGASTRKVDVRLIAATNRDLAAEINRGNFREDLYFRLNVVHVRMPPLRSRREDIPVLVRAFVERFAPGSPPPSQDLMQAMAAKAWPGNVRELRNAVERAIALSVRSPNEAAASPAPLRANEVTELMQPMLAMPIKDAVEAWTAIFERAYLENMLRLSGSSVSQAARLMGTNRRYVQRMMKRLGMRADDDGESGE